MYLGGYPKASSKISCAFLGIISSNEGKKRITSTFSFKRWQKLKGSNLVIKAEFNADNLEIYKPEAIIKEEWLERL